MPKIQSDPALSVKAYQAIRSHQRDRLFELEELIYARKLPAILVFEGWDAAGKGACIRELTRRLDPRGFKVYETQAPRTLEKKMPWLWRFWMQIPRYGQIAIFDRSWYGRVLIERVDGLVPIQDWIRAYEEINNFERTLTSDGTIFVKFWLDISEKEQLRRFILMSNNPMTAWEISAEDWNRHCQYKEYRAAVKDMLENTQTPHAPWTFIPATDENYCLFQVYCTIINTFEKFLGAEVTIWPPLKELEQEAQKTNEIKKAKKVEKSNRKKAKKEAKLSEKSAPEVSETATKKGKKRDA